MNLKVNVTTQTVGPISDQLKQRERGQIRITISGEGMPEGLSPLQLWDKEPDESKEWMTGYNGKGKFPDTRRYKSPAKRDTEVLAQELKAAIRPILARWAGDVDPADYQ